eukprot:CAMPEP_0195516768 /NCGR_PEP_ID=MMETSP0794_2-20130614/8550_1 /TAXON_ID=515487 /ORGANISM="Stephanopyxis turris, Strain CCMP 815" /LENGTH=68 /DNA_ID=CAMNT_0040645441 /DNA_START=1 /DNA_END=207 /DNA_ORIENTATION=-
MPSKTPSSIPSQSQEPSESSIPTKTPLLDGLKSKSAKSAKKAKKAKEPKALKTKKGKGPVKFTAKGSD